MNPIGFYVNNLGHSQLAYYLIRNANGLLNQRGDQPIVAFYENLVRPCLTPNFATMQATEAWSFAGTLIATDLSTAAKLLQSPGPRVKMFYVWDLQWTRQPFEYRALHAIYGNSRLHLIARSHDHRRLIEDCWNRPVLGVVDDCDMGQLLQLTGV